MDIAAGQEIEIAGRSYTVEDRIGGGSQGQVFRAITQRGNPVALKFITDPRRRSREAEILHGWSSEHVVGLLDHGHWQSSEVLVMDLVDGLTLQRLQEMLAHLKRGIHPSLALEIIAQIGQGLEEGYRTLRLTVHRDIKPSNIMLGRDGRSKILDFGIAYGLDLTVTGTPVATPLYMAPEQMEGARPPEELNHHTDQYALGLILAELLLGKPLRPMERDLLARWLFVKGAELSAARERIGRQAPMALAPLERMLAWDPSDRFPTMGHAVIALNEARKAICPPERLAQFGERLMMLRDQGRLLDASDPALTFLADRKPTTSSTIYPDMTEDFPSIPRPQSLSPARERDVVSLADFADQSAAPLRPLVALTPVDTAEAINLPGLTAQIEVEEAALVNTLDFKKPRRNKTIAVAAAAVLGVLFLGGQAFDFGSSDIGKTESLKASAVEKLTPSYALLDTTERPNKPAPVIETKVPAKTTEANNAVAKALPPSAATEKVKSSEEEAPATALITEPDLPTGDNWRSQVPVNLPLVERFEAKVVPGQRPGANIGETKAPRPETKTTDRIVEELVEKPDEIKKITEPEVGVEKSISPEEQDQKVALLSPKENQKSGSPLDKSTSFLDLPEGYIPPSMTPRQFCLKLTDLGLMYRSAGNEASALPYFAKARSVDPSYTALDRIIDGELNAIPQEEAPETVASKTPSTKDSLIDETVADETVTDETVTDETVTDEAVADMIPANKTETAAPVTEEGSLPEAAPVELNQP